ncbi:hypothetical protein QYE76_027879 [Lolium multiflorum]|uniref:KIB1-4 beta-propeller domain-containing protein n=1 Tax=Lolium multiflorum TaxID=4521 RepID=A0AAD8VGG8_LOLMU|nr:hypothetical protein QYE76_027879 [Lolium multiflorum]
METAESRPWSDLQPELLGLILRRLPSLADRVRIRAVCHPWRSNSMFQSLPLPFPWLALPDGTFLSIPNGEIHRISVPEGACCQGSIDNWLFLMHSGEVCSLMHPFSKTSLELPNLAKVWKSKILYDPDYEFNPIFYKLVVPSPLDSSPCSLVAAMIMDEGNCGTLCISQPPIAIDSFRDDNHPVRLLRDVAFFDRKLYVLGVFGGLFIIGLDDIGISSMECIIDSLGDLDGIPQSLSSEEGYMIREYLIECGSRLLMVKRWFHSMARSTSDDFFEHERTVALQVFEADLLTKPCRWRRASDLGGHALFLGQHSSKSLPASECSEYQEDCIYFMCDYPRPKYSANPLRDSGVYNIRDGTFTPLMSGSTAVPPRLVGQWRPTWFFPPEVV